MFDLRRLAAARKPKAAIVSVANACTSSGPGGRMNFPPRPPACWHLYASKRGERENSLAP